MKNASETLTPEKVSKILENPDAHFAVTVRAAETILHVRRAVQEAISRGGDEGLTKTGRDTVENMSYLVLVLLKEEVAGRSEDEVLAEIRAGLPEVAREATSTQSAPSVCGR